MQAASSPRISVVIPAYNCVATVAETIQSVLDQTFEDVEVLVINDGSTDATLETVSAFGDPRVRVHSFENGGLAVSRNRGIALARGEFVAFLDADDLWTPDKLADQLAALEAHPEAALAYSLTDHIDMQGNYLGLCSHHFVNGDVYAELMKFCFLACGSNPLVRKSVLDEVGGFDPVFNPAEDWDLWLRIARRFPFVGVPKPQILYRLNAFSMSSNVQKMEQSILRVLDKGYRAWKDPDPAIARLGKAYCYRYLTARSLQGSPTRATLPLTFRYWQTWVRHDGWLYEDGRLKVRPQLLKVYMLLKMGLLAVLPRPVAMALIGEIETVLVALSPESPLSYPHARRRTFKDRQQAHARRQARLLGSMQGAAT